jgi:hypothetical protein
MYVNYQIVDLDTLYNHLSLTLLSPPVQEVDNASRENNGDNHDNAYDDHGVVTVSGI